MMKKIFPLLLIIFLFSTVANANNVSFILYNNNQGMLGNWDTLQFLINVSDNVSVKSYYSPEISAELGKNFVKVETGMDSAFIRDYKVSIRNMTHNDAFYKQCIPTTPVANKNDVPIIPVYGASDGKAFKCTLG